MKIAILSTSNSKGGAAIAATRLHQLLLSKGVESHMWVANGLDLDKHTFLASKFSKWIQIFQLIREKINFSKQVLHKKYRFTFSSASHGVHFDISNILKQYDIIHLHWVNNGFLNLKQIQQIMNLPQAKCITMHDLWYVTGGCHYTKDCIQYANNCDACPMLNSANYNLATTMLMQKKNWAETNVTYIACSQWLADEAKRSAVLSHKENKIQVIPNPINVNVFKCYDKNQIRTALNLSTEKKLILFAAAKLTDPRKGNELFASAVTVAYQNLSLHNIEIVTMGSDAEKLTWNLPIPVKHLGNKTSIKEIAQVYAACDVFVTTSLEDNLPNTIIESMACGTPAVGFKIGGIPEIIDHKINGYLAEYKNTNDVALGIQWVLQQKNLNQETIKKVMNNFSEEAVWQQYKGLYENKMKQNAER